MFDQARTRVEYDVIRTERRLHAYEYVQALQVGHYDAICSVSGDGLLHEIINGLLRRSDWETMKTSLVIGGIPGGTGNGLIKSLLASVQEDYGVQEAAYLVLRGQKTHIDMTKLELEYEAKPVFSFLSVAWATIADIDLNSEVLRCLGALRFDIWGAWRVLSLLECQGTLDMQDAHLMTHKADRPDAN